MNKCVLIGRVTTDIELKTTAGGKSVTTFNLAVDRRTKDEGTDFLPVVAWNKTAEITSRYVKKGNRIGVIGRIATRNYEKDGKKVYVTEIVADEIEFLESKSEHVATEKQPEEKFEPVAGDEELPF